MYNRYDYSNQTYFQFLLYFLITNYPFKLYILFSTFIIKRRKNPSIEQSLSKLSFIKASSSPIFTSNVDLPLLARNK